MAAKALIFLFILVVCVTTCVFVFNSIVSSKSAWFLGNFVNMSNVTFLYVDLGSSDSLSVHESNFETIV